MTESAALPSPPIQTAPPSIPSPGVTPRAVFVCLLLAVFFGYIVPLIDVKLSNSFLGATHLPPGALGALFVLVVVINPLLGLISKRAKFRRNECLVVYISCLFSALVPGHGAENFIVSNLIGPFYFATRENKWLDFLQPHLQPWMTPALNTDGTLNLEAAASWYLPTSTNVPWGAWLVPLLAWGSLILASYVMLGSLSVILRRQWAEREALSFPLLKLPMEMVEDVDVKRKEPFWTNRLMWLGFGIAAFIQTLRGLNLYFPDVPTFPLSINSGPLFTEAPWNQMGWVNIELFPIAIGIAFLLTSEIGFSLWFFFLFIKFQYMAAYGLGYPVGTLPATWGTERIMTTFQVIGAYYMLAVLMAWTGREHFAHVAKRAFGRVKADGEKSRKRFPTRRRFGVSRCRSPLFWRGRWRLGFGSMWRLRFGSPIW
jgi:hypothetical protein